MPRPTFCKGRPGLPTGYLRWEAAGLRWLADAGGAPAVEVISADDQELVLARLESAPATTTHAEKLGRGLAATHAAGAAAHGAPPEGWAGDGWLGPLEDPLPLPLRPCPTWAEMYAEQRLRHTAHLAGLQGDELALVERVADRVRSGELVPEEPAARLHGDLWSGNVLWTEKGAVLIDPAAHGGHREADLAMLALFGAPHLERVLAAYQEVHPLADGWRERVGLHQLHPVLLHAALFGGGYRAQALTLARRYA